MFPDRVGEYEFYALRDGTPLQQQMAKRVLHNVASRGNLSAFHTGWQGQWGDRWLPQKQLPDERRIDRLSKSEAIPKAAIADLVHNLKAQVHHQGFVHGDATDNNIVSVPGSSLRLIDWQDTFRPTEVPQLDQAVDIGDIVRVFHKRGDIRAPVIDSDVWDKIFDAGTAAAQGELSGIPLRTYASAQTQAHRLVQALNEKN
jgi:hypothetical protein